MLRITTTLPSFLVGAKKSASIPYVAHDIPYFVKSRVALYNCNLSIGYRCFADLTTYIRKAHPAHTDSIVHVTLPR